MFLSKLQMATESAAIHQYDSPVEAKIVKERIKYK